MTQTKPTSETVTSITGKWKPYPAYKDSGIEWLGEIPEHWEVKRLKWLCSFLTDGSHFSPVAQLEGKPYVTVRNLVGDALDLEHAAKISEEDFSMLEKSGCKPHLGDVLLTKDGTIGKAAIVTQDDFVVLSSLAILRPNGATDSHYLRYYLVSDVGVGQMLSCIAGAALRRLTLSIIVDLVGICPPLPEQQAIAALLDRETARINALIAKEERLIELLQEKRSALISQAVTKGLDPNVPMKDSGIEWLGEIPAHWEVKRLKHVTSFVTSGSRGWAQYYSDDGAVFIRIGNLSRTSINLGLQDIQHVSPPDGAEGERTRVKQGDVLISITAYIGSVATVSEDVGEAYVNQHIALTRPRQTVVDSKWLGYCLLSPVGQDQFHLLLNGGTKDGLGLDDVKNLLVLIPPLSEQQAIVAYLDHETAKLDALISRICEAIEKLQEYSTALISAAVTGKIDVRENGTLEI